MFESLMAMDARRLPVPVIMALGMYRKQLPNAELYGKAKSVAVTAWHKGQDWEDCVQSAIDAIDTMLIAEEVRGES